MNNTVHPDSQQLSDYATGKLAENAASNVADHLAHCPQCESTIQALEMKSDTLVGGLSEKPVLEPYAGETELRRAVANVAKNPTGAKPPAADKVSTKAPVKLGPYQLLAKLGEGGMGAVFKARHEHLDKIVAIKVLPKKAMSDPAAVARFRREMKAVGALHHPNIVGAHDAGEAQGVHFLVMEYVEGSDLSTHIKKHGPVTVEQGISYVRQTACGLAFAHSKNIVHRDIKPANLLVDAEGTVKILDMGLARLDDGAAANTEANQGLTQTGQVMGTVDYMAPEQAFDTHRADAKADVYSLGCTLHRILTGHNAFGGETVVQKILAHREQPIPSLVKLCPTVPAALDVLYQRMMAKRPEERPTMAEVVTELEALSEVGSRKSEVGSRKSEVGPAIVIDIGTSVSRDAKRSAHTAPRERAKPQAKREPGASATGGKRGNKPPVKLIAGGIGGFALIVSFGIWLLIKKPDGTELKVPLEPGTTITVQTDAAPIASPIKSTPPVAKPANVPTAVGKSWQTPEFQQWVEATQKLPAEQQLEAVSKKLMELNPGFDGKLTGLRPATAPLPHVSEGVVTEVGFATDRVTDISPVRAFPGLTGLGCAGEKAMSGALTDLSPLTGLPLKTLHINSNKNLSDLAPLQGMRLTSFESNYTSVTDFAVLQGMPLAYLHTGNAVVADLSFVRGMPLEIFYVDGTFSDLSPLAGMPLRHLSMRRSRVTDLSPLKGMPLGRLGVDNSPVSDLSPLVECKELTMLFARQTQVTAAGLAALQKALPNCKVDWDDPTKSSTKPLAYLDPAFQQWVEATQQLPAEQQLEAVRKKLMELNPGFDGVFTGYSRNDKAKIESGVVTELGFVTDKAIDLSPVRALAGLKTLNCGGTSPNGNLSDLSPLGGMSLTKLNCGGSKVSDLSPLHGMQLTHLEFHYSQVSDLSPLVGMPLNYLNCGGSPHLSDLSPLKETTLANLICSNNKELSNLSPLRGMRLTSIGCSLTQVSDLSPLADCKDLTSLSVAKTKVTAEQVAALQKALPDCKIEWDDPAKAKAPDADKTAVPVKE